MLRCAILLLNNQWAVAMKCLKCGKNHLYRERSGGKCSACGQKFAFEPKQGDPYTDTLFSKALTQVSSNQSLVYLPRQLYYELARLRMRKPGGLNSKYGSVVGMAVLGVFLMGFMSIFWLANFGFSGAFVLVGGITFAIWSGLTWVVWHRTDPDLITLTFEAFTASLIKWGKAHGSLAGKLDKPLMLQTSQTSREKDLDDYTVERVIICDHSQIVDFLLANNFHIEQKCAVLSIGGYPPQHFERIKEMLKRNPALNVFVLHNASLNGCRIYHQLITDRNWFPGSERVFDMGLHPRHAAKFKGLWQHAEATNTEPIPGYSEAEMKWLSEYKLELTAIRPEQLLNRLRNVLNGHTRSLADGYASGDSGSDSDVMLVSSDFGGGDDDFG